MKYKNYSIITADHPSPYYCPSQHSQASPQLDTTQSDSTLQTGNHQIPQFHL